MPPDPEGMKTAIQDVIKHLMDGVMERVLVTDPFIIENHHAHKPLYAALVPDEIFKGSHFERRFVTPFGNAWESLAVTAATYGLGHGERNHTISGIVKSGRLERINEILRRLEHPEEGKSRIKPDWEKELDYILQGEGDDIPVRVVCDIYVEDLSNQRRYAFELKAPMPNSDQTKVSKEKIFKLYAMEPRQINGAYYALPYNPYGRKEDYSWTYPARWFNMKEDEIVLIGNEFWEKIGGLGTYQAFITAVNEIGKEYKECIYREFLGVEPPDEIESIILR